MRLSLTFLVSSALVFVACSSSTDSGSPPPSTNHDAGSTPTPTPTSDPTPFTPIPVTIKGSGRVVTKDSSLDCTSDGTTQTGACNVLFPGDTLYAQHGLNWTFDHWEPSMSEDSTLFVPLRDGPTALTAVFAEPSGGSSSGGAVDSGAD